MSPSRAGSYFASRLFPLISRKSCSVWFSEIRSPVPTLIALPLAPGASQSYSKLVTNSCGSFPDTVTATGRSICGTPVTASANATCSVTCAPQIKVYKQVVCYSNACEPFSANLDTQKSAVGVRIDPANDADCPAIDAWRMSLRNGTTVTRPAPQQDCAPTFGNSEIFGVSVADPTP